MSGCTIMTLSFFLLALAIFVSFSHAQSTYYISTSGNDDTGSGSLVTPFATLFRALNQTDVSMVYVLPGVYSGAKNFPRIDVSSITIASFNAAGTAVFEAHEQSETWKVSDKVTLTVNGLTFQSKLKYLHMFQKNAFAMATGSKLIMEKCQFKDMSTVVGRAFKDAKDVSVFVKASQIEGASHLLGRGAPQFSQVHLEETTIHDTSTIFSPDNKVQSLFMNGCTVIGKGKGDFKLSNVAAISLHKTKFSELRYMRFDNCPRISISGSELTKFSVAGLELHESHLDMSYFSVAENEGTGVILYNSTLSASQSHFVDNMGPGLQISGDSSAKLTDCTIQGNQNKPDRPFHYGGGIAVENYCRLELTGCFIRKNRIETPSTSSGGGIGLGRNATARISQSYIEDNVAYSATLKRAAQGGGIFCSGCQIQMDNTKVSNNRVFSSSSLSHGGGVYIGNYGALGGSYNHIDANQLLTKQTTVGSGNAGAGVHLRDHSQAHLSYSSIDSNENAYGAGGAVAVKDSSTMNVEYGSITRNKAYIGAVENVGTPANFKHTTQTSMTIASVSAKSNAIRTLDTNKIQQHHNDEDLFFGEDLDEYSEDTATANLDDEELQSFEDDWTEDWDEEENLATLEEDDAGEAAAPQQSHETISVALSASDSSSTTDDAQVLAQGTDSTTDKASSPESPSAQALITHTLFTFLIFFAVVGIVIMCLCVCTFCCVLIKSSRYKAPSTQFSKRHSTNKIYHDLGGNEKNTVPLNTLVRGIDD